MRKALDSPQTDIWQDQLKTNQLTPIATTYPLLRPQLQTLTQPPPNISLPPITPNSRKSIENIIRIIFRLDSQQTRVIDPIECFLPVRLIGIALCQI